MEKLIVLIIFIGISLVRGLLKNAAEKAEVAKRRAAGEVVPERQQRVQSEIDAFLAEVGVAPEKPNPQSRPAQPPRPERSRSQVRQDEARRNRETQRRQEVKRQSPPRQPKTRAQLEHAARSVRPAQREAVRSGVADHVDQYISQHVSEHLDHDIDEGVQAGVADSVTSHLGNRGAEMPPSTGYAQPVSAAEDLVRLLRDPAGIRQAILVNEVLSRPRALRK